MKYIFILFFSFASTVSHACKCADQQELSLDFCRDFDFISKVRIDSISKCDGQSMAHGFVLQLFKGTSSENTIIKFDCSSSCQMNIEKGDTWLFYAKKEDDESLRVSLCDRNRKFFKEETEDFYKEVNKMSFEEEIDFLKSNVGLKQIISESNESSQRMVDITQRENESGSPQNRIWLVVASLAFFFLFYFLFKKYFK